MMSKPAVFFGLMLAGIVHWMLFLTPVVNMPPVAESVARITLREIPAAPQAQEATPKSPPSKVEPPQPTPPPAPAPQPPQAKPTPTPPRPNLTRTDPPQRTPLDTSVKGDFAGSPQANRRPVLRIDWGTPGEAMSVVTTAGMRLVLLNNEGGIAGEVAAGSGGWHRHDSEQHDLSRYSNRVRIVDTTPAFTQAASLRGMGERLAVLLPLALEHDLRTQQHKVAANAGLTAADIRAFYGRFQVERGSVAFTINGYERISS
jgi:hypothetical protein